MEIEYRRTWNRSFMLVTGYVEEESYELRMLKHNAVMGLLPVQDVQETGEIRFCYDITGKKSLECYLENNALNVELLGQGFTWLDTGTHESLVDATNFVKTVETHQHRKIACLEEIAYLNGWISKEDVLEVYEVLKKNQYGQYLKDVLDGKYIDYLY